MNEAHLLRLVVVGARVLGLPRRPLLFLELLLHVTLHLRVLQVQVAGGGEPRTQITDPRSVGLNLLCFLLLPWPARSAPAGSRDSACGGRTFCRCSCSPIPFKGSTFSALASSLIFSPVASTAACTPRVRSRRRCISRVSASTSLRPRGVGGLHRRGAARDGAAPDTIIVVVAIGRRRRRRVAASGGGGFGAPLEHVFHSGGEPSDDSRRLASAAAAAATVRRSRLVRNSVAASRSADGSVPRK